MRSYVSQGDVRMRRYELTDEAWLRLEPLMPLTTRPGGQWRDHRVTLNGMFWVLNSGAPWRDLPRRYGYWKTVYGRYRRWTHEGLFDRVLSTLHLQLDELGGIDWSQFDIDGTNIRANHGAIGASKKKRFPQEPENHGLGRSRGGWVRSFIW